MGVVYKQRYAPIRDSRTPAYNVRHLHYIATRPGVIQNPGCGFGLWGRLGEDTPAENINNLKETERQMREVSKMHTIYRSIVSLDEDTAALKGYNCREKWQELTASKISAVAKENGIDSQDLRWCSTYHHEKGHPHVHVMFWDNSVRVREEGMSPGRFERAAEIIRASFNKEIFREELRILRSEQDNAKKELRALSGNHLEGFGSLLFYEDSETVKNFANAQFYPRHFSESDALTLARKLEELVYLLPDSGQLKYKLLTPNVKEAVDNVSRIVLQQTSLKTEQTAFLKSVADIAKIYGNSESTIASQVERAQRELMRDIGNDVLRTIKQSEWLGQRDDSRAKSLSMEASERMHQVADQVLAEKRSSSDFMAELHKLARMFPTVLTPRHEVLKDAVVSAGLRALTLDCINDSTLNSATKISQAFYTQNIRGDDSQNPVEHNNSEHNSEETKRDTEQFKSVYRHISQQIYDMAAQEKGWHIQEQALRANEFLRAFCRLFSGGSINRPADFIFLRELSRQAKKERVMEMESSSRMWNGRNF